MPFETLTLHGYVVSRTERLPAEEGESANVTTDIVVDGRTVQTITTVPLRAVPKSDLDDNGYPQKVKFCEAEVPYGSGRSGGVVGNNPSYIRCGVEIPRPLSHTLVSISTSDLELLELLRAGAEVEVRIKGTEFKFAAKPDDEGGYEQWEVMQPDAEAGPGSSDLTKLVKEITSEVESGFARAKDRVEKAKSKTLKKG